MSEVNIPLVVHVIHRLDYGGLENGLVNLINQLPRQRYRHAIIALTEITGFSDRLKNKDEIQIFSLRKKKGKDWGSYWRLFKFLRQLKPKVVHSRNIGTLDCLLIAWLAGVPVRIHGEHGWDVYDPNGTNKKYLWMRRIIDPFVSQFVTVSKDLRDYLVTRVGIEGTKVLHICNGVDTDRFLLRESMSKDLLPSGIFIPGCIVVGSTTRFNEIKDPLNLVRAFILLRSRMTSRGIDVRLLMVGDGPLRLVALKMLADAGVDHAAWLPGSRDDIPELLSTMDIYVLGSLREGISNTLLESMATGLPLIATATGGNLELIESRVIGELVPPADSEAMARVLEIYVSDPIMRKRHGAAARVRAVSEYSLKKMINAYQFLYDKWIYPA